MSIERFLYEIPSLSSFYTVLRSLEGLGIEVREIGGDGGKPIYALRVGKGSARIAIVATQHGSEPAPALATLLFLYKLVRDELRPRLKRGEVLENIEIVAVPLANPYGFEKLRKCLEECGAPSWACSCAEARPVSLGIDMNRDWLELRTPNTRAIHALLRDFEPHLVLDLHEFYAKSGSPPRWARETEGFEAYVTDAPYLGVSPEVMWLSSAVASRVRSAIEGATGFEVRIVRPGNGLSAQPPIYLGTHFPLEGYAKVLVETWGTGLGRYLLYERVTAHVEAMVVAIEELMELGRDLEVLVRCDRGYDRAVGEAHAARFVIKGSDVDRAEYLLREHGVKARRVGSELVVEVPQPRFNRIALAMLDRGFYLNKALASRSRVYTLDRLLDVVIEKVV